MVKIQSLLSVVTFGEPLLQLLALLVFALTNRGVCRSKAPLCVHSRRLRVYRQHARMFKHIWACYRYTRRCFESTHTEALWMDTLRFFSAPHHTTPHTTLHTHHDHAHNHTQQQPTTTNNKQQTTTNRHTTDNNTQQQQQHTTHTHTYNNTQQQQHTTNNTQQTTHNKQQTTTDNRQQQTTDKQQTNNTQQQHKTTITALHHHGCFAQCNIVTLGVRPPIQLSAVRDRSLMWPYHITGTPGCSTPLCSVPQHCTQGR